MSAHARDDDDDAERPRSRPRLAAWVRSLADAHFVALAPAATREEKCTRIALECGYRWAPPRAYTLGDILDACPGGEAAAFHGLSETKRNELARMPRVDAENAVSDLFGQLRPITRLPALDVINALHAAGPADRDMFLHECGVPFSRDWLSWTAIQANSDALWISPFLFARCKNANPEFIVDAIHGSILAYVLHKQLVPVVCFMITDNATGSHRTILFLYPTQASATRLRYHGVFVNTGHIGLGYDAVSNVIQAAFRTVTRNCAHYLVQVSLWMDVILEEDIQWDMASCTVSSSAIAVYLLRVHARDGSIKEACDVIRKIARRGESASLLVLDALASFMFGDIEKRIADVRAALMSVESPPGHGTDEPDCPYLEQCVKSTVARRMHDNGVPVYMANYVAIERAMALGVCPSAGILPPTDDDARQQARYNYTDAQPDAAMRQARAELDEMMAAIRRISELPAWSKAEVAAERERYDMRKAWYSIRYTCPSCGVVYSRTHSHKCS